MQPTRPRTEESAYEHFVKRAPGYDTSSSWVGDEHLLRRLVELVAPEPDHTLLDLATGTGLVAARFFGTVRRVVGLDLCSPMTEGRPRFADELVLCEAEALPFDDLSFDRCTCRQGLQFMDLDKALPELYRVLRPGGVAVLCHLTAHGPEDRELAFEIQRLRNPARRNFFLPGELPQRLAAVGFGTIESQLYRSRESVSRWIENGALPPERREAIRSCYHRADPAFLRLHEVTFEHGDIHETMLLELVRATRPTACP